MRLFYFLLYSVLVCSSCFNKKSASSIDQKIPLEYMALAEAKNYICTDKTDNFFKNVRALDIAVQMQKPLNSLSDKPVEDYKLFLKNNTLEFTDSDKLKLKNVFNTIRQKLEKINIDVDLNHIKLIKVTGKGYGSPAFYTRMEAIVIPEEQLSLPDDALESVMLHEIFHIYSRYHPEIIQKIYAIIGFEKLDTDFIIADPVLSERMLLNPDGLNMDYYIPLFDEKGNRLDAVPVIYSTQTDYTEEIPDFFTYLKFDLYRLLRKNGKNIAVSTGIESDIGAEYMNSFFNTIGDNTQYIIHPDEIMADNFMLMVNAYYLNNFEKFSEKGKSILEELYAILSSKS